MTQVLAVVGPTASGKTELGIRIAEAMDTEIISADSMQVYQGMEIGTAAPAAEEQARVPHHFVSFVPVTHHYSAADFAAEASAVVARLNEAGKIAVVVGGSGLYLRALIDGLFEGPPRDDAFRAELRAEAEEKGIPALYARLKGIDPAFAATIHPNDMRRIERGLEVHHATGQTMSALHAEHRGQGPALDAVQIALDWPRDVLYRRIEKRVDKMMEQGFEQEVQALLDAGHAEDLGRLRSRGHPEIAAYLRGEYSRDDAIALVKRNTRRMARRQLSWFRSNKRIEWIPFNEDSSLDAVVESLVDRFS